MTRLPTESWDMKGLEGPDYPDFKVGPTCSVPGCTRLADHSHHIVRRSFLAGPFSWVRMPDGMEIGNLTGLCWKHHQEVTEGKSNIYYENGVFLWDVNDESGWMPKLEPQPPTRNTETGLHMQSIPGPHEHVSDVREKCPTCKRPMPKEKIDTPKEEKKMRATWAVGVPVDAREDGADTLDTLLEAAREEMAKKGWEYGSATTVKFFVLSHALAMFVQNADQILADS